MRTYLLIASVLLLLASAPLSVAAQGKMEWIIGPDKREALVFAPALETNNEKHPVIFAFHGHGGTMRKTADNWDFQTVWPQAIVVYPQGLPGPPVVNPENRPNGPGWQRYVGDQGDRDLKLF